jgi:NTE family protein
MFGLGRAGESRRRTDGGKITAMGKIAKRSIIVLTAVLVLPLRAGRADVVWPTGVSCDRVVSESIWNGVCKLKSNERPRVILVLGGGGAKGLAHIGVLRVFQEERMPVDQVVGVSVGALIGALYSAGLSVDDIDSMANDIGWNKLTDFNRASMVRLVLSEELLSSKKMEDYLNKHIGNKLFSDLNIPFACVATDIGNGERVVFREGPVAIAARASATFPAVFHPVEYRHRMLVDGGVVDNLPTDIVERGPNDVIVAVTPKGDLISMENQSIFKSLVRTIEIQKDILSDEKKKTADFLIEPIVSGVSVTDLGRSKDCIEAGMAAARARMPELKKLIISRVLAAQKAAAVVPAKENAHD